MLCSPGKHLPFPGRVRCQTPGTAAGKVAAVPYAQIVHRTVGKGDLQVESYDGGGTPGELKHDAWWTRQGLVAPSTQAASASENHLDHKTHSLLIGFVIFFFFCYRQKHFRIKTCSSQLQELANHFSNSPRFHRTFVRHTFFVLNVHKPF